MYERYALEFLPKTSAHSLYREQLLPFAQYFYRYYIPAMSTTLPVSSENGRPRDAFVALLHACKYFKKKYPSKLYISILITLFRVGNALKQVRICGILRREDGQVGQCLQRWSLEEVQVFDVSQLA